MPKFSNQSFAVVTGASSGIGYELAKQFAQNGFDLLTAADGDGIHQAASSLQALGAEVQPFQINLADHEGVHKLIEAIRLVDRPVDAVAINAGSVSADGSLKPI
jgi:short-subunit dehydrogenase